MNVSVITIKRPDGSIIEKHAVLFSDVDLENSDRVHSAIEKALKPYAKRFFSDESALEYFHRDANKDAGFFFSQFGGSARWSAGYFRDGHRFSINSFELNEEATALVQEALEIRRLADFEGSKSDRTDMRMRAETKIQHALCGTVEWVVVATDSDGVETLIERGLSYDEAVRLVEKTEIADRQNYEEWLENGPFFDGGPIKPDPQAKTYLIRCYRRLTEDEKESLGLRG